MAYLDHPCEIFRGLLDDDDMIYSYERALEEEKTASYTLLLLVSDTLLETVTRSVDESSDMDFDPERVKAYCGETVKKALALNPKEVLRELDEELEENEKANVGTIWGSKTLDQFTSFEIVIVSYQKSDSR